jgi:hypothetical protein
MAGGIFDPSRSVANGAVRPVQHGTALVALAGRLRLDVELVRELVEDLPCMFVERGEVEAGVVVSLRQSMLGKCMCYSPFSRAEEKRGQLSLDVVQLHP